MVSENSISSHKLKRLLLPLIGALAGIVLLLFGGLLGGEKQSAQSEPQGEMPSPKEYAESLEAQIEELCAGVEGVGALEVTVSLKGTYRAIYATDRHSSSSGNKSTMVLVGSGSSESAVLVGYENPEIAGIGIVCEGGDRAEVRRTLISLVSAAFDVGSNKIFVVSGEKS